MLTNNLQPRQLAFSLRNKLQMEFESPLLGEQNMVPIVVLIASIPRLKSLVNVALPAIKKQTIAPRLIVIVSDRRSFSSTELLSIQKSVPYIKVVVLNNTFTQGAAGSWNTGIKYIRKQTNDCFIALLDDDDSWSDNHLEQCAHCALKTSSDLVISGMDILSNGVLVKKNLPNRLSSDDFLVGNPGWQGSNTFIHIKLLEKAGDFSSGLVSCNDRDLAIRVLDLKPQIAFTSLTTVTWNINHRDDALSAKYSHQKLIGVSQFYRRYNKRMSERQKELFFQRIDHLFKWSRQEVEEEIRNFKIEQAYLSY